MNVGLDSSVVLRLLVGRPEDQTERALAFLDTLKTRGDRAVVSDLVVAEVYFALQHHYGVPKKEALSALSSMFEGGEVLPMGSAAQILDTPGLATAKPGFVDRLIHAAYSETPAGMVTFEKASGRLKNVQVL